MSYRSARRERYYESQWPAYVPVAERRRRAELAMEKLRKKGHPVAPVKLETRKIATTFWGMAWCDNLEGYADFANRIERGRTYVRNGSVVDLQIAPRAVTAIVSGSELYNVNVTIAEVPKKQWSTICTDCAGGIDSLVELLQGRFSKGVMERICRPVDGLFPKPAEITFKCSCPDWAYMCKHVAAVLYGIGARLDQQPELLFRLRAVDEKELVARIDASMPLAKSGPASGKVLADDDLSALFGLDMDGGDAPADAGSPAAVPDKPATRGKAKRGMAERKPAGGDREAVARRKPGAIERKPAAAKAAPAKKPQEAAGAARGRVAATKPVATKARSTTAASPASGKSGRSKPQAARDAVGSKPRAKAQAAAAKARTAGG